MILVTALLALLLVLPGAPAQHAPTQATDVPGTEACFAQQTNVARAAKGLASLPVSASLADQARAHSAQMASSNTLYHSTTAQYPGNWTGLGENVGEGPTCNDIQTAFLNSPHHYENIIDPSWTVFGVGVTFSSDGSTIWVTVAFESYPSAPPPPPPPPTTPAPVRTTAAPPPVPVRTTAPPVPARTTPPPVPARTTPPPAPSPSPTTAAPPPSPSPTAEASPTATATATPTATATSTVTQAAVPLAGRPQSAQSSTGAVGIIGLVVAMVLCVVVGGLWTLRDRERRARR